MKDIIIVGGGLSGLISAITLSRAGLKVLVIEKKSYPFHRVCGEYISNEVLPFLQHLGIDPFSFGASRITRLQVTSPSGKELLMPLGLGGFGISRHELDFRLYQMARKEGVDFELNTQATAMDFKGSHFEVTSSNGQVAARFVIGCFGKRSNIDRQLDRAFFKKRSPYMGIKYHVETDHPDDLISLHIFKDGYCGISKIEENKYCLCYLSKRDNLKSFSSIKDMEMNLLSKNPHLKRIFQQSNFVFDRPEVINEISFEKKTTVENHMLMVGDAVGMISPLCGNGMAMAIHSAKILSDVLLNNWRKEALNLASIESDYKNLWTSTFAKRLWIGRKIQNIFGNELLTSACISLLHNFKPAGRFIVDQTHGKSFA